MKNNKLTPQKYQELAADLVDICNTEERDNKQLLEYIIDEYLYLISDNKVAELEDIIVNEFGYDLQYKLSTMSVQYLWKSM